MAAEVQALVNVFDHDNIVQEMVEKFVDSRILFNFTAKNSRAAKRRLLIDVSLSKRDKVEED